MPGLHVQLTTTELERARRELQASLALARPDSPARVPILARLSAIDIALVARPAGWPEQPRQSRVGLGLPDGPGVVS